MDLNSVNFPDRKGLVSAVSAGLHHPDGIEVVAGGRRYLARKGAAELPDLPGWEPLEPVTLDHYGAIGDGKADDQAAWIAARRSGHAVYLPKGRQYLVRDMDDYGLELSGPGAVVCRVSGGGVVGLNDEGGPAVQFRHFAHAVKLRIAACQPLKVVIFGDSTATSQYNGDILSLVRVELENLGIGCREVLEHAVAGDTWGSRSLAQVLDGLADQKHLAIIKFGINDAGAPPRTIEESARIMRIAMRRRLSEIRASAYGAAEVLSILLIMPNALGNSETNTSHKNNLWLRRIRGLYREAARDFECALYDPFVESAWAEGQGGKSLDHFLTHPKLTYSHDIWSRAIRAILEPAAIAARNRFQVRGASDGFIPRIAAPLSSYPRGLNWMIASPEEGWPSSGLLITEHHHERSGRQVLIEGSAVFPRQMVRHWRSAAAVWSNWAGAGSSIRLALLNGWTSAGQDYAPPAAMRTLEGMVHLSGALCGGIADAGTALFQMPAGLRPGKMTVLNCAGQSAPLICQLCISPSGVASLRTAGNVDGMFLDGLSFMSGG